jgi:hypothetical protein
VAKAILVGQFLRARAWWRLDSAGNNALHVARSVVSLLDAAAYLREVPDDHPDIVTLDAAGCFQGGIFDPGAEGAVVIRDWQLADEQSGAPDDLLSALAKAADRTRPGGPLAPMPPARALAGAYAPGAHAPGGQAAGGEAAGGHAAGGQLPAAVPVPPQGWPGSQAFTARP